MTNARAWRAFVFCGAVGSSCLLAQNARAAPALGVTEDEVVLSRVEVATSGDAERDSLLFERVRSLFSAQTTVVPSNDHQFDQRTVLSPQRTDTVYIWIRVTERSAARVYLTLAEQGEQPRYLFREIKLDSALDEVGSETLAEVAHSSARDLWLREQQSSRATLVDALERETPTQTEPPPAADPAPVVAIAPAATVRDSAEPASRSSQRLAPPV